jgi:hypothetical protein
MHWVPAHFSGGAGAAGSAVLEWVLPPAESVKGDPAQVRVLHFALAAQQTNSSQVTPLQAVPEHNLLMSVEVPIV